jgi:hypothetical protein
MQLACIMLTMQCGVAAALVCRTTVDYVCHCHLHKSFT